MAMESLVIGILDQIALEGPQGCLVAQLWPLLESNGVIQELSDPLKQLVWGCLLQRLNDIRVCRSSKSLSRNERSEGRSRNRRQRQSEESGVVSLPNEEANGMLRDFHAAEEQGLRVVASDAVRDAVLGLHDASLSSYAISETQRKALEAIARARQTGVLRSELAKRMGMEPKNFAYVTRALEARNLITQQNISVKAADTVNRINTNILHLPRFKLNVVPGMIKEVDTGDFVVEDEEAEMARICSCLAGASGGVMLESEVKRVLGFQHTQGHRQWRRFKKKLVDSGRLKESVGIQNGAYASVLKLEQPLSAAPGLQTAPGDGDELEPGEELETVAELGFDNQILNLVLEAGSEGVAKHKLATRLGMTNKKAHKLMVALSKRVRIRESDEQQGRAQMKVWRAPEELLQYHQLTHAPAVPSGGWQAAVAAAAAARPDTGADHPIEAALPLATAPHPSVPGMLRSVPVGQAAAPVELAGSSAPDAPAPYRFPELPDQADALAPFEFPQPPDQSAAPAPFEFPAAPDQAQAPSARSGNDGAGPSSMPPFLGEGTDAHGNEEIASGPTMSTTAHASSNGMPEIEQEGMPSIGQEGVPPLVQSGTIQILGATGEAKGDEQKVTTLSLQRQQRLADRVTSIRFMMVSDVPAFFQETEVGMRSGHCDQRTRNRIIDRCLAAGQVMRLLVQLPGKRTKHKGFNVEVLTRVGTPLDFTFLNEVRECAHLRRAERFRRGQVSHRGAQLRAEGVDLPVVDLEDGISRGAPAATQGVRAAANLARYNEEMELLTENGFLRSRMVRVRLLHYFICRLMGLGGNVRSDADLIRGNGLPNSALQAAGGDKEADLNLALQSQLIQIKELANLRAGQNPASTSSPQEAAEREGRRLSLKGLWDAMPVDLFFQVVGCSMDRAEAEKLSGEDKRMGELEAGFIESVSTAAACSRLRESLDTMRRMGLLEKESRPDQAAQGSATGSDGVVYLAQASIQLELPISISHARGEDSSGIVQPGGLRVMHHYDLAQKAKLDEYWARLEYACLSKPVAMRYCWPAKRAPEVVSPQGWQMMWLMSAAQARQLRARIAAEMDSGLDWVACHRIATDLKLSYTQVMKIATQFRSKERLERLKAGAQPLPKLPKLTRTAAGRLSLRPKPAVPQVPKSPILPGGRRRPTEEEMRVKRAAQSRRLRERHAKETELRLQQQAARTLAEGFPDEEPAALRRKLRKMTTTHEEDCVLVRGWVRWHAVHGVAPGKQCFRNSRRLLPDYHMLETQASRRIARLMKSSKTKNSMERLLALAGQVHARESARTAASQPAATSAPAAEANGDAGAETGTSSEPLADASGETEAPAALGRTEAPAADASAHTEAPAASKGPADEAPTSRPAARKGVLKGTKRKPRLSLDTQTILQQGAAVGEIVRQLADGKTAPAAVGPGGVNASHPPPRKRRRRVAAQKPVQPPVAKTGAENNERAARDATAAAAVAAEAHGKRGGAIIEANYKKRMAAIGQAMQDGPLFKVVTPEDAAALKEAEELVEDVLAAALTDKKVIVLRSPKPPRRVRPTAFPDGAPILPKERRPAKKRKAPADATEAAAAARAKRQRGRAAAAAARRPSGGDARPEVQVSSAFLKGRTLVQQWRSAVGRSALNKHLAMPAGSKPPSTSVAVAMELIKSLLLVAEASPQETPTPDAATALVRRFSQVEITEAFGYLRKAGHVNHGASNRPFHLSDAFKDSMQVADLHPEIFVEAAAARERMRAARLLQEPPAAAAVLEYAAEEEVPSGMVAEALSHLAVGELDIQTHDVTVEPAEAGEEEDPMIGPLSWRIPLRISRGPPPQTTPHPPSHPKPPVSLSTQRQSQPSPLQQALQDAASSQQRSSRVAGEGVSSAAARKGQQERLFWPEAVGTNWIVRSAAETACVEEWTAKHGSAADDKALLKDALTLIREAGPDGLTMEQLSSSASISADKAQELVEAALRYGLVQMVGAYQAWAYVASEHCQRFRPDVASSGQPSEKGTRDLPAATPANPAAQQGSSNGTVSAAAPPESTHAGVAAGEKGAAGAQSEDQQGAAMKEGAAGGRKDQQQGELKDGGQSEAHQGQEVSGEGEGTLLQPWSDHRGRLNEPFLRSITQRAVSIVIRHPGIPEELLVEELAVLSPHSARRLLQKLLEAGLVTVRSAEAAPAPEPPAIFRRARQQLPPESKVVKHYFPNLSCCFGQTTEVSLQAFVSGA